MVSTNTMSLGTLRNLLLLNVFNYYIYIYNYLFTHDSAWQIKQLRTRDSLFLAYDQNVWYLVSNQNLWVSAFSTLKQIFNYTFSMSPIFKNYAQRAPNWFELCILVCIYECTNVLYNKALLSTEFDGVIWSDVPLTN